MTSEKIISILPYSKPFLFVDSIKEINEKGVTGSYTFRKDDFFYEGHFKDFPVTPGVILTETMAQIGVACLGIFLLKDKISLNNLVQTSSPHLQIAMTSAQVDYFRPVFPEEKITVTSEKVYFRFGKLKCNVQMENVKNELVCKGVISGMIKDFYE